MIGWKIGTFALELVVWYKPTLYNIELYKLFVPTIFILFFDLNAISQDELGLGWERRS